MFYDKAIEESPRSPAAHFGMATLLAGRRLLAQSRPAEAIERYRLALKVHPGNAEARGSLERAQA